MTVCILRVKRQVLETPKTYLAMLATVVHKRATTVGGR